MANMFLYNKKIKCQKRWSMNGFNNVLMEIVHNFVPSTKPNRHNNAPTHTAYNNNNEMYLFSKRRIEMLDRKKQENP